MKEQNTKRLLLNPVFKTPVNVTIDKNYFNLNVFV